MIAAVYFDSAKWFERLIEVGCTQAVGKSFQGRTQEYFLWETAWGHKFLAPHHCTMSEADDIVLREVVNTKPQLH